MQYVHTDSKMVGKKRKVIDGNEITLMRERGLTWTEIGERLHLCKSTLRRWRIDESFVEPQERISDIALDELISTHIEGQPRRGEITLRAHVCVQGFNASRQQVRDSMHRVDPEGVLERSRKPIKRRVYNVAGPHHLWHMDGNHKLIRWGIVIHGCIDGCTRNIIYLVARDNNRAETVLNAFVEGVARYQLPLRVRGDLGGENIRVADYMILHRGVDTNAFITGSSTHNTRIERLWRDMRNHTIQAYIQLFRQFETEGMLLTNLLHIYTLQFIFIPLINADLLQFINMWNKHKLSSEHNRTPEQLMYYDHLDTIAPPEFIDPETYGVEERGEEPVEALEEDPGLASVVCDPIECPFDNDDDMEEFRQRVFPFTQNVSFDNFGAMYRSALIVMNDIYGR